MKKETVKGIVAGVMIGSLLSGGAAFAKNAVQSIDVTYRNIKVYKDGVLTQLKDSDGVVIEPFIYQGTTYLPARGAAELAGMDVEWDGSTSSIYLWDEKLPGEVNLLDVCPPYQTSFNTKVYYPNKTNSFLMLGNKYSNGLTMIQSKDNAYFNLDGKYKSMTMTLGLVDGQTYEGYVAFLVDGKLVAEYTVKPGSYTQEITIPLNYGLHLEITGNERSIGRIGLGNITVQ